MSYDEALDKDPLVLSSIVIVPDELRSDTDIGDLLGKALRGDIELKPLPEPRHRCLWCWLLAKLPGHTRCKHGQIEQGCSCVDY